MSFLSTNHANVYKAIEAISTMASDVLTQLQTLYDQLLTQFFSTVSYLSQRHPLVAPAPIHGDSYTNPPKDENTSKPGIEDQQEPFALRPVSPDRFAKSQNELAEDLVRKAQQIQYLIERLPGLGKDEQQQKEDIEQLVEQVKAMELLRKQKRKEMRDCVRQLDDVVLRMATSINIPTTNGAVTNGGGHW